MSPQPKKPPAHDSVKPGKKYGSWTVLAPAEPNRWGRRRWLCRCKCRRKKVVIERHLVVGDSIQCRSCANGKQFRTHGETAGKPSPEYEAFYSMRKKKKDGTRSTISPRWQGSDGFSHFLADMGRRPSPAHKLARRDASRAFSPENCYWRETRKKTFTYQDHEYTPRGVAFLGKHSVSTVRHRLYTYGWSPDLAVEVPAAAPKPISAFGESKTAPQWEKDPRCRVSEHTLRRRIFIHKWDSERAITTPPQIRRKPLDSRPQT